MGAHGEVHALWRYPVKSVGGERVDAVQLDARGVIGDRRYAVYDPDGKLGSGKNSRRFRRMDGLLDLSARYDGTDLVVRFPDGAELRGTGGHVDAALAAALARDGVQLRAETSVPHFDAARIHLITTASLAWLGDHLPDAVLDERRFRPNVVIHADGSHRVEDAWVGRTLRIGTARLRVSEPTERCVMTTAQQPGLPADGRILKTLGAEADLMFGVYAEVVEPGTLTIGDRVAVE